MKLNHLYFPSFNTQNQLNPNLTLIHGWGANSRVWEQWATEKLGKDFSITLIDLPGFGDSPILPNSSQIEDHWISALVEALPEKTHLLGWSLGGLLAQQIALRHPERIQSLICLTTTPCFTNNDSWRYSISSKIVNGFIKSIQLEISNVLKKFWHSQLHGSSNTLIKAFTKRMSNYKIPSLKALNQGLILLKDMDNRKQIKFLSMPTLWLLGEKDPLIPQDIRLNLASLQPNAKITIIPNGSHVPFFSQAEETANFILSFLQQDSIQKP